MSPRALLVHALAAAALLGPCAVRAQTLPVDENTLRGFVSQQVAGANGDFNALDTDWSWDTYFQLGIARSAVYVANAVKHFKYELRGKRRIHKTASQREAAACLHWLDDEIRLVRPQALVALGATAARALLGHDVAVTKVRGQWLTRADGLRVLVTLHPSAVLRMPPGEQAQARRAWLADLRL